MTRDDTPPRTIQSVKLPTSLSPLFSLLLSTLKQQKKERKNLVRIINTH